MKKKTLGQVIIRDFKIHKWKYFILIPVMLYFILFHYKAMYGVVIAFQKYRPSAGIAGSKWVGFNNFVRFFNDPYFLKVLRNTFAISFLNLVFSFPMPIILALLLNEVKVVWFKKIVQTITYMPHFIAMVVVCGLVTSYCQSNGLINDIIVSLVGFGAYFHAW